MPRPIHLSIGLLLLIETGLCIFCDGAHAALVLDESLQGSITGGGTRSGGTFVTGGWQVVTKNDTIYWHVPTITNGAAEFDVRGLYPNECRTGNEDKVELFHMYDYTYNDADINYSPGYREDPYKHFIRKTDCLDTGRVNSMEILWQILPNYNEPDTAQLSWDSATTYHFREEWGPDGAGNSALKVYRDGVLLLTTSVPGSWNPAGHSVRIGASPRRDPAAGAPLGAVFSNVKVWDLSSGVATAPIIIQPASNSVANTTLLFVQWASQPHVRYQVRANRVDDPDSGIAWDSGEVTSSRNDAWIGPLPDQARYFVYARLGDATKWGPWSAGGYSFSVDTTTASSGDNVVRVQGHSLRDNSGPFLGLGVSYFQALRRAKYDRTRLNADLALLASKGFNYVRILSMVNWDGLEIAPVSFTNSAGHPVSGWPDYWQQFRELLDIVAQHGLRSEVTIFADAQYVMPNKTARQAHLNGILTNIVARERKIVHLEVANEAWQNGFPGSQGVADLREFAQYLADRTPVPVAITSNDDISDAGITSVYSGSAADLATVHFTRDVGTAEGGWLPVRDCYRAGNLTGVPPVTSNEPIGPGSSVSSENDPIKLCAAAVFAFIANLPAYVYHSRAGVSGYVNCCPPSGGEVRFENTAGINAYQYLRQILPPDLASWVRNDGLEASAPFTVFCNGQANQYWPNVSGATNGCHRNIGSGKGREFVCFPMGILSGGVTLQARRPIRFRVFNPLTGAVVSNLTMNVGNSITLPQGPGAYILKGSFSDTGTSLVPKGAVWKYLDNGSDQGTPWKALSFNDGPWASGPAQLGFGDDDEATVINGGPSTNRFVTTYFRRAFPVADKSAFTNLSLRVLRDDGAIVYLNGVEVFRSNMPTGLVTHATNASSVVSGADETTTFYSTNLSPSLLINGMNVLAVEVHQANATSTDSSFDLELVGIGNLPPVVNITSPANDATLGAPANVAVNTLALDSDGVVTKVEFFVNGIELSEDTGAPFALQLTNLPVGTYALSVSATDDSGASTVSATNTISVKALLVSAGADWKYLDNGSNQDTAWRTLGFNDAGWLSGPAQLGFGDEDEATLINGGPSTNRFVTTYFRRTFTVADPAAYSRLNIRLLRDDGAIVYLNNSEVFRSNMPTGIVTYSTNAASPVTGADENIFYPTNFSSGLLVTGANLLAVEVHQANATSSDLSFDLELSAVPAPPRLGVTRSGQEVVLSWPPSAAGFRLQTSLAAGPAASWTSISTLPGQTSFTATASGNNKFYRLWTP